MRKLILLFIGLTFTACEGLPVREFGQTLEGAYDVETRYDMEAISGTFAGLAGRWSQPDQAIFDGIVGQIREDRGSTAANLFVNSPVGEQVRTDITGYLRDEAPPWVMNLQNSLEGVDKQLGTVDMQAAWVFVEKEDGRFEATQSFEGVAVFDDPECRDGDAIFCDQIEVTSAELLDAEYPVNVLTSTYDVTDLGEAMALESHSLDFNYGRLGLYLLVNLILPDSKTEGVGLRDIVLASINCNGLAGRLAGDDGVLGVNVGGVPIGLDLATLVGNCENSVFGITSDFVGRFNAPVSMDLAGNASIADTNRDGKIDQLNAGELAGDLLFEQVLSGQAEEGPVDALFTGFRVGDFQ